MYKSETERVERDWIGERVLLAGALYGIHTARAVENFPLARRPVHPGLTGAYGAVNLACALTNKGLGVWKGDPQKTAAIVFACREMASGKHIEQIVVDELQGGAGTSTNMNVNEVLANRALSFLSLPPGRYDRISPLDDFNRHQSTNDTYPTALRCNNSRSSRPEMKDLAANQVLSRCCRSIQARNEDRQDPASRCCADRAR